MGMEQAAFSLNTLSLDCLSSLYPPGPHLRLLLSVSSLAPRPLTSVFSHTSSGGPTCHYDADNPRALSPPCSPQPFTGHFHSDDPGACKPHASKRPFSSPAPHVGGSPTIQAPHIPSPAQVNSSSWMRSTLNPTDSPPIPRGVFHHLSTLAVLQGIKQFRL